VTDRTCAITGANGLIGQAACRRFQMLGWRVIALVRKPRLAPDDYEARAFTLGEPLSQNLLADVNVLVHTAYDFSLRAWADICRINVVGSDYLFDAATRAGVKRQIFISSMAAFEGCRSNYGLSKLATEDAVRVRGGVVIRPGLVYGGSNNGLTAKIASLARSSSIIPMIGTGRYPLYTCYIDDLCALIVHMAQTERPLGDVLTAANASPVTLRALVEQMKGAATPSLIFPIPWQLIAAGLWMTEAMGLQLSFRSDSVISIVHANKAPDFTAVNNMGILFRPFTHESGS